MKSPHSVNSRPASGRKIIAIASLGLLFLPPAPADLISRYKFNEGTGDTVTDTVSGKDGLVLGDGAVWVPGKLILPGGPSASAAYVDLPNGILSENAVENGGTGMISVEGWYRVTGTPAWGRIFDFGSTAPGGEDGELDGPGGGGEGLDYFLVSATRGTEPNQRRLEIRNEDPAGGGATTIDWDPSNYNQVFHQVVTWDETTGDITAYEDGELVQEGNTATLMSDINDVNNWLGRSNWTADSNAAIEYTEFRIYNEVLDEDTIKTNLANGPDSLPGDDVDGDGIPNFYEELFDFLNPDDPTDANKDQDGDTLTNVREYELGTILDSVDSDTDGVNDDVELARMVDGTAAPTDPLDPDSDDDALLDGVETGTGAFVSAQDTGSDPLNPDSDGDTYNDALEVANGTDPNDANSNVGIVYPPLVNRWDFSESDGTTVDDSIGNEAGEVKGDGFTWDSGRLILDGGTSDIAAYVDLPNGLLSRHGVENGGTGGITFEGWVKVIDTPNWGRIFDFGDTTGGDNGEVTEPGGGGEGLDYIALAASRGTVATDRRLEIRNFNDGTEAPRLTLDWNPDNFDTEFHFVTTWDERNGQVKHYEDGELIREGQTSTKLSEINDVNNWLARSNWTGDSTGALEFDEFRIYADVMIAQSVKANTAAGPDNPPGGAVGAAGFQITDILLTPKGDPATAIDVSLTFTSKPGSSYAVEKNTDLQGVWEEVADGVDSESDLTTFKVQDVDIATSEIYFRVREE
ncbi:MAG: LamG-like jellyroll fold domain-containing protein [Verrucomicrobiales bacterium]